MKICKTINFSDFLEFDLNKDGYLKWALKNISEDKLKYWLTEVLEEKAKGAKKLEIHFFKVKNGQKNNDIIARFLY